MLRQVLLAACIASAAAFSPAALLTKGSTRSVSGISGELQPLCFSIRSSLGASRGSRTGALERRQPQQALFPRTPQGAHLQLYPATGCAGGNILAVVERQPGMNLLLSAVRHGPGGKWQKDSRSRRRRTGHARNKDVGAACWHLAENVLPDGPAAV